MKKSQAPLEQFAEGMLLFAVSASIALTIVVVISFLR